MLYSGHLSIADTFSRNQLSPAMVKPLYFEPLYSGHLPIADTFSDNQWCPLLRGFTVPLLVPFHLCHLYLYHNYTDFVFYDIETCFMPNKKFDGADLVCIKEESAESCQQFCQQEERCQKFSYNSNVHTGENCCLKEYTPIPLVNEAGVISGPKYCYGEFIRISRGRQYYDIRYLTIFLAVIQ